MYSNSEITLNHFLVDINCHNSDSFSMNILSNNYIMIGCVDQSKKEADMDFQIINKKGEIIQKTFKIKCGAEIFVKDFTVTKNGTISLIAYDKTSSIIDKESFVEISIPTNFILCKKEIIYQTIGNDYTLINNELNQIITVNQINCGDSLKYKDGENYQKLSNNRQVNFNNIYFLPGLQKQCTFLYKNENENFLQCEIELVSCNSSCKNCYPSSKSETEMNCMDCSSPQYYFSIYDDVNNLGNCCLIILHCKHYNNECNCDECEDKYNIENGICMVNLSDRTININNQNEETIILLSWELSTNQKILIETDSDFKGILIDNINYYSNNNFEISNNKIKYQKEIQGTFKFHYRLKEENQYISNKCTITLIVCKFNCICDEKNNCLSCSEGIKCYDLEIKNITQIIINDSESIDLKEDITNDKAIKIKITYDMEFKGILKQNDNKIENNQIISSFNINYEKKEFGKYIFKYQIIDSDSNNPISEIGVITLLVCDENCDCNDSDLFCIECLGNLYKYKTPNGILKCYLSCPPHLILIESEKECKECPIGSSLNLDTNTCETQEIKTLLNDINKNPVELANKGEKIENDKYIVEVYYTNNTFDKNYSVSNIDFSECEKTLKEKNIISQDESLIIAKIDNLESNSILREVQYQVYNQNGEKVNLEYCKDVNIDITYPINNPELLNLNLGKSMSKDGIDIFNSNDSFFNDICYSYSINGKDIILNDRREHVYQNVTICKDTCEYNGINYEYNTINCKCNVLNNDDYDSEKINNENKNLEIKNIFSKSFNNLNINISKCYKLLLKWKNLRYNIGFIFGGIINITEVILIFIYFIYGFDIVYSKLFQDMKKHSIKKVFHIQKKNSFKNVSFSDYDSNREFYSKDNITTNRNKNSVLEIINEKIYFDNLPFNSALNQDKRNFWNIFKHNFMEKFPLIRMFYKISKFELLPINMLIYFTNLEILFGINGLFYTNNQISTDFNNNLGFYVSILNSIYSFLCGILIFNFLKLFIIFTPILDTYVKEIKEQNILIQKIKKYLKLVKIKFFIFIFINHIIVVYFWYYMTIFCIIYNKTQIKWFIRCWISFSLTFFECLIFSFLFTSFRFFSLKYKNKNLYNTGLFLRKIL